MEENKENLNNAEDEKEIEIEEVEEKDKAKENEKKEDSNLNDEDNKEIDKNSENDDKKTEEQKDELTKANETIAELKDKYQRLLAEFDNFRKRNEKEKMSMFDFGAAKILEKFLPIVDNIERGIKNIPEDLKGNAFVEGIDKTYKQIEKLFSELDVKPIEALGKKFDANLHNAVMSDEESEAETDTITEEMLKGYTYKDEVIRHSMVKVKK